MSDYDARRWRELARLARFAGVGTIGFVVNLAVVTALSAALGVYLAGIAGFVAAATSTWWGNRLWTFADAARAPMHHQWLLALTANTLGFALYYGTYVALLTLVPLAHTYPIIAIAAGALAGMGVNFTLARRVVFR